MIVCVHQLFKVVKFRNTHSKILKKKKHSLVTFQSPNNAKFSFLFFCPKHVMNLLFRFTGFPSFDSRPSPRAVITCCSQLSMLTTVKNGSSRIRKRIRYTVGLAVRIFPATTRNFTKGTALSEHGRGTA